MMARTVMPFSLDDNSSLPPSSRTRSFIPRNPVAVQHKNGVVAKILDQQSKLYFGCGERHLPADLLPFFGIWKIGNGLISPGLWEELAWLGERQCTPEGDTFQKQCNLFNFEHSTDIPV